MNGQGHGLIACPACHIYHCPCQACHLPVAFIPPVPEAGDE